MTEDPRRLDLVLVAHEQLHRRRALEAGHLLVPVQGLLDDLLRVLREALQLLLEVHRVDPALLQGLVRRTVWPPDSTVVRRYKVLRVEHSCDALLLMNPCELTST